MAGAPEEAAAARIAARQHGVITVDQLRSAGFGRSAIARRVRGEWLVRIHEGVYRIGVLAGPFAAEMAALLACGPLAVISHRSAVVVMGVRWRYSGPVELVLPHDVQLGRAGVRCRRVAAPVADEIMIRHGLRITTPARTLVDLSATASRTDLERITDEILAQRLASMTEILGAIGRGRGRPGLRKLRAVADLFDESSFTRSEAERRFRALLGSAGLPIPRMNVKRAGWEVDAVWDRQRLIVEVDGYRSHGTRPQFERDRVKDAQLMLAGYRVLRVTWRQLTREPAVVVATIAAMLGGMTHAGRA